jgi:hypothetical protein
MHIEVNAPDAASFKASAFPGKIALSKVLICEGPRPIALIAGDVRQGGRRLAFSQQLSKSMAISEVRHADDHAAKVHVNRILRRELDWCACISAKRNSSKWPTQRKHDVRPSN